MEKLDITKIHEWTNDQVIKVYSSREYQGMGDWSSVYTRDWFGAEEVHEMAMIIADVHINIHVKGKK